MNASLSLQKAIYERLLAEPALKALIGDPPRVYDAAPPGGAFPFVLFGEERAHKLAGADGLIEHDLRLIVHSRHGGRSEIKDVLVALIDALDGAPLILEGARLVALRAAFFDIFPRADAGAHQGVLRLRAVTEDAP
jgi:hypothetical protein